ncbi:armadillo-like helical domain-containing protein 3 isoform X1 [Hydra vulgaris]|nr:armadillo-like helical domain-containing protein 3 [Hydra vulgaris]
MSTPKKCLKEKIVLYYDQILQAGSIIEDNRSIWDEFFLLKVNVVYLEERINNLKPEQLLESKGKINELFLKCVDTLKEDNQIKIVNSLLTLCTLMKCVFRKKFSDFGYDVINILIGFDQAEQITQKLFETSSAFLLGDYSVSLKNLVLKMLLIIVTAVDNVSSNTFLEYLMMFNLFDTLAQVLANPVLRERHGYEAVIMLCILLNYRKNESVNPYLMKLSLLDDELALNGLGLVISNILSTSNRNYYLQKSKELAITSSLLSSLTTFVGSMFVSNEDDLLSVSSENDAVLLALYEAVLTNRSFFTVLSHVMTHEKDINRKIKDETLLIERSVPVPEDKLPDDQSRSIDEEQSRNLMATLLRYSSIAIQDTKTEHGINTARLCLSILSCITEDQYANSFLHDANMTFSVPIYKLNLYHRKVGLEVPLPRPLACVLLDLMVEFTVTHMMKRFPIHLYQKCVGIIHRCLCYQKKCRIRLQYCWKSVWTSLMHLLKFIVSSESFLIPKYDVFDLCTQVINIFNLFITYGDTFLPTPTAYDDLYYEIIRVHQIFDNLYTMALRYISSESELRVSASKLTSCLVNVRAIIHHFSPKINSWSQKNNKFSLSEEEVLTILRENYDTLTLKLMDGLDSYVKRVASSDFSFFTQMVRSITNRVRSKLDISNLEQRSVLEEFSSIK